ncbi:LysR family transcriptional regulator [Vibrio marisflavi]|uniref:HTH lysR-type domain-containing protein n=1 Tax=Vibrio marisflavi CECT 7928 TaxID=634439 RepID=A0ABM8ZZ90_9VIBR|nr:LysR family transcriptional regulator [Vibrio marisflavi]CAH0536321.1 hypothetical protein VMF7928_00333 [Vibrio marisflavi CECT 7928]
MAELIEIENIHTKIIKCFVSVYELGSISKAAQECNVSQPTISKAIKSLESQFCVGLFNRDTRLFSPTDAAKQLYPKCVELCSAAQAICSELEIIKGGNFGEIRIGFGKVIAPLGSLLISKIVSDRFNDVNVSVIAGNPTTLHRSLLQSDLDFFICHTEGYELLSNTEQLICKPFSGLKVDAVVAPKAKFLSTQSDITKYPWTFPKVEVLKTSQDSFYLNYYRKIKTSGSVLYEIDNADARMKLVLSGKAATVSASIQSKNYISTGQLKKLPIEIDHFPLSTFYLSTKQLSQKSQQILAVLKNYIEILNR